MKKIKYRNIKKDHEKQGFVLIVGVILMAFLLLLAVPFMFQLSSDNRLTKKSSGSLTALYLAEAGIERVLWELSFGDISTWSGDSSLRTMTITGFQASGGNVIGDIDISIADPEGDFSVAESTGSVAYSGSQTVERTVRVELIYSPVFRYAAFGDTGLYMGTNAAVDSYDSRLGFYGGSNVGSNGDVGVNATGSGDFIVENNAHIYGDAIVGPGSNPDEVIAIDAGATISGEKSTLVEQKELPSVTVPTGLPFRGDFSESGDADYYISESGEYSSFNFGNKARVTITADVTLYITGAFTIGTLSMLNVSAGASLKIYLGGTFTQVTNSQVNNLTQDPTSLLIMGTDSFTGTLDWNSNSQFWGAIYTPNATINLNSNADFYGSAVSRYTNIASNSRIHYDEALRDLRHSEDYIPFTVLSWQEKLSP